MNSDSYRRRAAASRSTPKADGATTITSDSLADRQHHADGNNLAENIQEDLTS